jgi:hypothetical protein
MASLSVTITNGLNVSGQGPTEKWDAFDWGTDVWLGPQSMYLQFVKNIIESVSLASAIQTQLFKGIANGVGLSDAVYKQVSKYIANTVTSTDALDKKLSKYILNDVALASAITKTIVKLISNAISVLPDPAVVQSKGIWDVVFPGGTTDATGQSVPTYTEQAKQSTTWSSINAGPTTWTEL